MDLSTIGQGAVEGLEEFLAQRLFQQQLAEKQQEQQRRARMEEERLNLDRRRVESDEAARLSDEDWRRGQRARADASDLVGALDPGEITTEQASILKGAPATAARVTPRRVIQGVRAIGAGEIDESGPQEFSVLEPTREQAKEAFRESERDRIVRGLGPRARQAQEMTEVGLSPGVVNEVLRDPKQEFNEWRQKEDYQEGLLRSRPVRSAPTRTEMTPGQAFSATRQLRNDFTRETTAAREVTTQLNQMRAGMDAVRRGDKAAGSQAILVTFQKILDPASVVRESEYARSSAGQSLLSRMEGFASRLAAGGAGVPDAELERFVTLAEQFAKNQLSSATETKAQIDAIAEEYGLDPAKITRELGGPDTMPPGTDAPGARMQRPIPGIQGGIAESTDGGKTWRRVK